MKRLTSHTAVQATAAPARVQVFCVFLTALLAAHACGAESNDMSTETGNPPLLTADKVEATPADGEVVVSGERGAVDPGGSVVEITNSSSGEATMVISQDDGSFEAAIDASPSDEISVRATGESANSEALTLVAADELSSACEKICAGPQTCGARETLFPIVGCDCDDGVCECSMQECVEQCRSDMLGYGELSDECWAAAKSVRECIAAAPCRAFAEGDQEAIFAHPECEAARSFEDVCGWGGPSGGCSSSGSGASRAGSNQVSECDVLMSCTGTNYGVDCHMLEDGQYRCNCRLDGASRRSYITAGACGWEVPDTTDTDDQARFMRFYCGFDVPLTAAGESSCKTPEYAEGPMDAEGACSISAQCEAGKLAVECEAADDGVLCTCSRDGAVVNEQLIEARGCLQASGIYEEGPDSDDDVISALGALCGMDLYLE